MMAHCFSVEYCCGVYQNLMEISKLCYFYRLPEGLLYIHLALVSWVMERERTGFFIDLLTCFSWMLTQNIHMIVESSHAVFVLISNSMNYMRDVDTKQHLFCTFDTIEKADYLSGVRLVALKRAVVVCFLVREEEATA